MRSLYVLLFMVSLQMVASQELNYELLFEVEAQLKTSIEIGKLPMGERTIFPFDKGTFKGPKMKGTIGASGADWSLKINETTSILDIRGLYTLDSGEHIYVQAKGYLHFNQDGTYYLRSTPIFETTAKGFEWLNHTVSVGVGELSDTGVKFRIYEIK